jgi:hypothetical protein
LPNLGYKHIKRRNYQRYCSQIWKIASTDNPEIQFDERRWRYSKNHKCRSIEIEFLELEYLDDRIRYEKAEKHSKEC